MLQRLHSRFLIDGFTLLEMLLVVAVIGILGTAAISTFSRASQRAHVSEAQTLVLAELNRARSSAWRHNRDQRVSWTATTFMGRTLPNGVRITEQAGSFDYRAPFGEVTLENGLTLTLRGRTGRTGRVVVLGVTGKPYLHPVQ